ncbi:hypothetical protein [Paenibacillus sp. OAS669]|uniref:hypothetical protein n=1 Tax=Paenibacillus sp. OAS669 TaxID=2663821 RepID=UPI00178AE4B0|nr:hypothetical protein [Paenibacillus sp. OAS669]MBE1444182.1 hypothetical protein [Paenibacillus sp. OAS669]
MTYNAKTNWKFDEIVTEKDFNRIELGIQEAYNKLDDSTPAADPNTLVERDMDGRFKAMAPVASDDVARKAEVDAIRSDGAKPLIVEVRTSDPVNPELGRLWVRSDL